MCVTRRNVPSKNVENHQNTKNPASEPCAGCITIETVEWLANDYAKMRLEGGLYLARSKITDRYHPLLSLHLGVAYMAGVNYPANKLKNRVVVRQASTLEVDMYYSSQLIGMSTT